MNDAAIFMAATPALRTTMASAGGDAGEYAHLGNQGTQNPQVAAAEELGCHDADHELREERASGTRRRPPRSLARVTARPAAMVMTVRSRPRPRGYVVSDGVAW